MIRGTREMMMVVVMVGCKENGKSRKQLRSVEKITSVLTTKITPEQNNFLLLRNVKEAKLVLRMPTFSMLLVERIRSFILLVVSFTTCIVHTFVCDDREKERSFCLVSSSHHHPQQKLCEDAFFSPVLLCTTLLNKITCICNLDTIFVHACVSLHFRVCKYLAYEEQ